MKYTFYIYLVLSQNRLVITQQKIVNIDYHLLMYNDGFDPITLNLICKTFCLGYICGNASGRKILNDPNEFA